MHSRDALVCNTLEMKAGRVGSGMIHSVCEAYLGAEKRGLLRACWPVHQAQLKHWVFRLCCALQVQQGCAFVM